MARSEDRVTLTRSRRRSLPPNLYEMRAGYYRYRVPATGKFYTLGRNKASAVSQAIEANLAIAASAPVSLFANNAPNVDIPLLEIDALMATAQKFEVMPAIYFLLLDAKVIYVGQTMHWPKRLMEHKAAARIPFDSYSIVPAKTFDLDALELGYILKYRPPFNAALIKRGPRVKK